MMQVMVMVKATPSSEAGQLPSEELMAEMGKFNEELVAAGVMKAGEGLKPSSEGVRVRFSGSKRTVTDGPFAETKELVAGYWLWEVASLDDAVQWVKRCPNPMLEDSDIEIRPLFEMADFAQVDAGGEHAEREQRLRRVVEMQDAAIQPYLFFGGRCEEALAFYEQALGARVVMKMRFNESPDPLPEGAVPSGFEDKIMHASFQIGQMHLMASDGCDDAARHDGYRLAVTLPTAPQCEAAFRALADGGVVDMPLSPTFWSASYGQVTDKFGVGWMVMVRAEEPSM